MVGLYLTYPGDNEDYLFDLAFFTIGGCFLVGGDSSTMENTWYT